MLYDEALSLLPEMIHWRRQIHQHAEIGYELPLTLGLIKEVFDAHNIKYDEPCKGTLIAELGDGPEGLILRADTDALPMKEVNNLTFTSKTPYAHCCGHDLHTAMLMAAACILKRHEQALTHRTRLVFQPDEEGATGARFIVDQGVINNSYQGAFALHVSPVQDSGVLYYSKGPLYASNDKLEITIDGVSTHGAAPQNGCDPVFAAVQVYNALQGLISREIPSAEPVVLSICAIHGGEMFNIVPDQVQMLGTLRTYNLALRDQLVARMKEVVSLVAQANRCRGTLHIPASLPPVVNDEALSTHIINALEQTLPADKIAPQPDVFSWSEDFSLFADKLPISMMTLGTLVGDATANIHNADVLFDEKAMPTGAASLAAAALYFEDL